MKIHERPPHWYVDRLENGDWFALAGYSDAEWCCVLGLREGERTALGQIIDPGHGLLLADILRGRAGSERFLFAVPKCLCDMSRTIFGDNCIDWWLGSQGIRMEAYERDSVTDDLACEAGLYPFINQLRKMDVVLIGPAPLRGLDFLGYRHFVEISSPNLHLEVGGIERAVAAAVACWDGKAVYLVSAGVSAAVIIDHLYPLVVPGSYLIDCGSIWDAFVGIGEQRHWRAELYADPPRWEAWKRKNLTGQ